MQPAQTNQELEDIFRELGISQYLDTFVEQGFDTWETILDIQESDLDALGVKLGHRRRLQRRIANARGIDPNIALLSIKSNPEESKHDGVNKKRDPPNQSGDSVVTKRKYRRHPKPDENAPERPMSAYVLFSNKLRETLKGDRSLSFTEIAKLVGEHWQSLPLSEREVYEAQARASKDRYYREITIYKQTEEFRRYNLYLDEFNEKQAKLNQGQDDAKRARLEKHELSHGSSSAGSSTVGSSTALGGSTSTASGSSSERMRKSESRERPSLRHNSANSILSAAESQHSSAGSVPSPATAQFDVDISTRNKSQHLRRGSSSLRGLTHQADVPQPYLPSLSDMLAPGQGKIGAPVAENATASSAFQHMKVEETSDGDVLMTSADAPPASSNTIAVAMAMAWSFH
ncbi:hypothetical protein TrVFT333_005155 [Trichoderma virens FT-333]|nr:hypothetical protein TrVFT333_005155 [Trichoderma virens FT-333]